MLKLNLQPSGASKKFEAYQREVEAVAAHNRLLLDRSGLSECAEAKELASEMERLWSQGGTPQPDALIAVLRRRQAHEAQCPICLAQHEFLEKNGLKAPPMPVMTEGLLLGTWNRICRFLRVPDGEAGEGRRAGVFIALMYSAFGVISVIARESVGGPPGIPTARNVLEAAAYLVAFFVACLTVWFLAGAVFDATRRVAQRLSGYVIRAAVGSAIVLGPITLLVPGLEGPRRWLLPIDLAAAGGMAGAVLWISDRLRGRIGHQRP